MEKDVIIPALENCIGSGPCKGCPFDVSIPGYTNFPDCTVKLLKEALKLIRELTEPTIIKEDILDGLPYEDEEYDTVFICNKCGGSMIGRKTYCASCGRKISAVLKAEKITEVEFCERTEQAAE